MKSFHYSIIPLFHRSARKRWLLGLAAIALAVAAACLWKPLAVQLHLARARQALAARHDEQAVEELQAALRWAPGRPETLLLLARACRRLGKLGRAGDLIRQAGRLGGDPQCTQRERWLLEARAGRLQDAVPRLEALLTDPRDDGPDIWDSFIQGYLANMLVAPARQLLDAWQKEDPEDSQQYFLRAQLSDRLGKPQEAVEALRRGLSLAPGEDLMRYRLALELMSLSDYDEAAEELRRCGERDPENPEILAALAECLRKRGEVERAADVLRHVLAHTPDFYKAHRMLGEIALSQGRPAEALPHLEHAAKLQPHDIAVRFMLGQALRAVGRTEEAKAHLDYVARADEVLNRVERQCRQAILRPDDVELRYQIGTELLAYGNPEDGVKWLLNVLQLRPDHAGARRALADYYKTRDAPRPSKTLIVPPGPRGP